MLKKMIEKFSNSCNKLKTNCICPSKRMLHKTRMISTIVPFEWCSCNKWIGPNTLSGILASKSFFGLCQNERLYVACQNGYY